MKAKEKGHPLLVVSVVHHPAKGVKTERKGWAEIASNWNETDIPQITTHVSKAELRGASIVLNLVTQKFIKNRFNDVSEDDVRNHYLKKYSHDCELALVYWARSKLATLDKPSAAEEIQTVESESS